MIHPQRFSFMDAVVETELLEFAKSISPEQLQSNGEDEFFGGNLVFKAAPGRKSFTNLLFRSRVITHRDKLVNNEYPRQRGYKDLMNNVTRSLITISESATLREAMNLVNKIYKNLGNKLYGALLIKGTTIINPLHPLVATAILNQPDYLEKTKYRVVVYLYNDRQEMDSIYNTSFADQSIIDENLNDLLQCYLSTSSSITKVTGHEIRDDGNITISYKVKKDEGEEDGKDHFLIANQILTEGIFCPYYGTTLVVKTTRDVSGCAMSPMLSCNIRHDESYNGGRLFDSKRLINDKETPSTRLDSVCTGSLDNRTIKGLRTLTHSNASSPYNRNIISDGSLAYVDSCIKKSIDIYELTGIIEPEIVVEVEKVDQKEEVQYIEEPAPKRKRRTKAQIEADRLAAESISCQA